MFLSNLLNLVEKQLYGNREKGRRSLTAWSVPVSMGSISRLEQKPLPYVQ